MPIKLYYFPLPGRAEVARLLMTLGNVEFEDVRLPFPEWQAVKPKSPFGQMPFIELEDGRKLAQSNAISVYCAKLAGMYPADPYEAALQDQACGLIEDVWMLFAVTMRIQDKDEQIKKREEILAGPFKDKAAALAKLIESSPGEYIGGDKLSYGDLTIFTQLSTLKSGWLDGLPTTLLEEYPVLKNYRNKIASVEGIKKYYEENSEGMRKSFQPE